MIFRLRADLMKLKTANCQQNYPWTKILVVPMDSHFPLYLLFYRKIVNLLDHFIMARRQL